MAQISNKDYTLRIYKADGTFVKALSFFSFNSFRAQINSGLSEFIFTLPNRLDNFGEGSLIDYFNKVELWVVDPDNTPTGGLIYSGFIYAYGTTVQGTVERVTVNCYGYAAQLGVDYLRNTTAGNYITLKTAATQTLTYGGTSAVAGAIETIVKAIIDRYNAESGTAVTYMASSVETTGQTLTYTFDRKTVLDALNICLAAAPVGWWYYIGADNVLQFRAKPTTAKHTLILGKDFVNLTVLKNSDSVANFVLFDSSGSAGMLRHYSDSASIAKYGYRFKYLSDSRVTDTTTADNIGNSNLSTLKNPKIRITVTILDNNISSPTRPTQTGYDIEKFQIGDTVQFRGFNSIAAQSFFNDNMQIVAYTYNGTSIDLELEQLDDNIGRQVVYAQKTAQYATATSGLPQFT